MPIIDINWFIRYLFKVEWFGGFVKQYKQLRFSGILKLLWELIQSVQKYYDVGSIRHVTAIWL